ncbi:substrate-binding periplasmic protein [Paludibacterium paludis]|uniref:Solute-binding protein family 3/N-terminal domain-containing protein n=1 Tax=Paludibacterium paludis TaxID=1225769 RepID=A0A918UBG0_9NEIS|nr:transporter substrate-binding domain-containing protein [Paludibacterium paludis]GGY29870.1 hypothetical protein GCM10011289_35960 [Paludibacterium paludis]
MKRPVSLALFIALSLTVAATRAACPQGGLKVGYLAFGAAYSDGRGIDVDLVETLANQLGCPIARAQAYPRARVMKMLEQGELNLVTSAARSPERERLGYFLVYEKSKNMTLLDARFGRPGAETILKREEIIWGKVRSFVYGPAQMAFLDKMTQLGRVIEVADNDELFQLLARGAIQGMFCHPFVFDERFRHTPLEHRLIVYDAFPADPELQGGLLLAKSAFDTKETRRWQDKLDELRGNGTLAGIFRKHLSRTLAEALLP